jgi:hypothetical protein
MSEPTEDDVLALRRDGDLPAYLRSLIRKPARTAPVRAGPDPRHQPGAWPYGTHPTNSAICRPDCPCNPAGHPET